MALSRSAIGGVIAVNQTEARLPGVRGNVESNTAAVGKLRMEPRTHQLAKERIALALDQQLGDALFQRPASAAYSRASSEEIAVSSRASALRGRKRAIRQGGRRDMQRTTLLALVGEIKRNSLHR
jgi:hypothetical protein